MSRLDAVEEMEATGDGTPELVETPGCAAIADVAAFFRISPASDIKCVAYMALKRGAGGKNGEPDAWHGVAAFLRGDHQVNETKLLNAIGAAELRTMQAEELEKYFKGPAGYLGPVGLTRDEKPMAGGLTVVVDKSLEGRQNLVCGANKLDYHLRNVVPGRDFTLDAERGYSQREGGRGVSDGRLRGQADGGHGGRGGAHFQAGRQVHEVNGLEGAGRERQGSDADHGLLRDRDRADS